MTQNSTPDTTESLIRRLTEVEAEINGMDWTNRNRDVLIDRRHDLRTRLAHLRNDPAKRQPGCPGGTWCRCDVSTPC